MLDKITELSSKEMDRKEFLQSAGIGMLLLVGGGMIVRTLGLSFDTKGRSQSTGYGATVYGGRK